LHVCLCFIVLYDYHFFNKYGTYGIFALHMISRLKGMLNDNLCKNDNATNETCKSLPVAYTFLRIITTL